MIQESQERSEGAISAISKVSVHKDSDNKGRQSESVKLISDESNDDESVGSNWERDQEEVYVVNDLFVCFIFV